MFFNLRILQNDQSMNKDETNEICAQRFQDRMSFLQAILLAWMNIHFNEGQNENDLTINEGNIL